MENVDYIQFQSTISSPENIRGLSQVFSILTLQKICCLILCNTMIVVWPDLWVFQSEKWYLFALVLGICSYVASYLSRNVEQPFSIFIVIAVGAILTLSEAYLIHFWLHFLPESVQTCFWSYEIGVYAVFAVYLRKFCFRIEFKVLAKLQLLFLVILTIALIGINYPKLYYFLVLAFAFNIIAYVHSYKTIQFLFGISHGWTQKCYLRTSLDLYIDNQVLFPLALIDTANFVVDAIGYE